MRLRRAPVGEAPERVKPKQQEYRWPSIDNFTQEEARERSRAGYSVEFGGRSAWSLVREVREVCGPLAGEIVGVMTDQPLFLDRRDFVIPDRYALHHEVDQLAAGVRETRDAVVALLVGEPGAPGAPADVRRRLHGMATDPGFHATPEITEEHLRSGEWVELLVGLVEPLESDLSAALRRAPLRPEGPSSISRQLSEALEPFYAAARVLEGRQGRIAWVRESQRSHRRLVEEQAEAKRQREQEREQERVAESLRRMKLSK